ncbi:MAG: hypothetical protein AABZ06_14380 [Bdellovibrionota bacterium]
MKKPNWSNCTEEELWKYVATHLTKNGIDTVLVGGAVVAIYTEGAYRSGDLDFVLLNYINTKLPEVMAEIGFKVTHSRHYSHPKCKHIIIDFVTGPPGIGDDYKIKPAEIKSEERIIKIYSPTDCIRDRLASYIYFKARECLEQAVMVGKKLRFDKTKVKKWCTKEGAIDAFNEFNAALDE